MAVLWTTGATVIRMLAFIFHQQHVLFTVSAVFILTSDGKSSYLLKPKTHSLTGQPQKVKEI